MYDPGGEDLYSPHVVPGAPNNDGSLYYMGWLGRAGYIDEATQEYLVNLETQYLASLYW